MTHIYSILQRSGNDQKDYSVSIHSTSKSSSIQAFYTITLQLVVTR